MTDLESRDRAEFEQWATKESGYPFPLPLVKLADSKYYRDTDTRLAWLIWQAARAGNEELRECLQGCYVLLESLCISMKWGQFPVIEKTITELVARAEALLERGKE